MSRFASNRLLLWVVALLVFYWCVAGPLLPGTFISITTAYFALLASIATLYRYFMAAWKIIFHRLRNDEADDGSHLAVLGIVALASGVLYAALFVLVWNYFGAPKWWSNTVFSSFPRALWGIGFILLLISPDVTKAGLKMPKGLWSIIVALLICSAIFFIGMRVGEHKSEYDERGGMIQPKIVQPQ